MECARWKIQIQHEVGVLVLIEFIALQLNARTCLLREKNVEI